LAPAPDLGGVDVDEVGATSQGDFVAEGEDAWVGGEVAEDGRVAVGEGGDEGAAGVFVNGGAQAVDVFAEVAPVAVAVDRDGASQNESSCVLDETEGEGGEDAAVDPGVVGVVVFAGFFR